MKKYFGVLIAIVVLVFMLQDVGEATRTGINGSQIRDGTISAAAFADSGNFVELVLIGTEDSLFIIGTATDGVRLYADTTGGMKLDGRLFTASYMHVGDSLIIIGTNGIPFVIGTATDGVRFQVDSTGNITADGTVKGDSAQFDRMAFVTTDAKPFVTGTADDAERAYVDSSGNAAFDGWVMLDSLYATEANIITEEDSTLVIGTATDAQRFIVDSTGNVIADGDLSGVNITGTGTVKGDSLYITEINIITEEDTTLVIGTATDAQRAIIDSSGNAIFDGDLSGVNITGTGTVKGDSLYITEANIITEEDTTLVIGTATDAQRAIIDSSGNAILDGDLTVAGDQTVYGCMKMYESSNTVTIDATDQYHLISDTDWATGEVNGVTFTEGTTGPIASFEDYSGTVVGTIKANDVEHGLSTGDIVSITGSDIEAGDADPYYGIYSITVIDNDAFYFTNANWNATQTATWNKGAYLTCATAGKYFVSFNVTGASSTANADVYKFKAYVNATEVDVTVASFTSVSTEMTSVSGSGILDVSANGRIFLAVENQTDGDDWDLESMTLTVFKL